MQKSNVDDSLFGKKGAPTVKTGAGVISLDELRSIRKTIEKAGKHDAVIISRGELARIKDATTVKTKADLAADKRAMEEAKNTMMAASKTRRAKMLAADTRRDGIVKKTEWQKQEDQKKAGLQSKAAANADAQLDDVKHMNQMVLYSKVVTIRDKQLEENQRLESEYVEEQKKLDLMMEIERLKLLKKEEEFEVRKAAQRKHGAQVIVDQIQDRTHQRMKEQELRDKERLEVLAHIERMRKEDEATAVAKRDRINRMMKEAAEANAAALGEKDRRVQEAKDEEQKIIAYQRAKDAKEYEAALEAQRVKDEKEKEIQRLREMQEKAADRQAEIDALRAKRAFEEGERQARLREKLEQEKRQRITADLEHARQKQFAEKQASLAEQARIEREDYMSQIHKQKMFEAAEKTVEEEKAAARKVNESAVRAQISGKDDIRKQERVDYLEEGKRVREKVEAERQKIRDIQAGKIEELNDVGIDKKYLYDL